MIFIGYIFFFIVRLGPSLSLEFEVPLVRGHEGRPRVEDTRSGFLPRGQDLERGQGGRDRGAPLHRQDEGQRRGQLPPPHRQREGQAVPQKGTGVHKFTGLSE